MYYLYDTSSKSKVPLADYYFTTFNDFYNISSLLTRKITGEYIINITSNKSADVIEFINNPDVHKHVIVYISLDSSLLSYILSIKPGANTLTSVDPYTIWTDAIQKMNLHFDSGCVKKLYWNVKHDYGIMLDALTQLKEAYGTQIIKMDMISKVIPIDEIVYPRSVMYSYIKLDRYRNTKLKKSLDVFGNDIVFYSMRKNIDKIIDQKIEYYKSGLGTEFLKSLPFENMLKLKYAFISAPRSFNDITVLLKLYEKGEYLDDYLQETTI